MRTAITVATLHGGKSVKVVRGPEVPVHAHLTEFTKDYALIKQHTEFEAVELWTSDEGVCRRREFTKPKVENALDNPFAEVKAGKRQKQS